jgi:hypothetical protein
MPNLECVPEHRQPEKSAAKSFSTMASQVGAISETGLGFLTLKQQLVPVKLIVT